MTVDEHDGIAVADWPLWSTTARLVVTEPASLAEARAIVEAILADVDQACSRFRPDSELSHVAKAQGRPVRVSPLLADLVHTALWAAERTSGDVDPTIGAWLCELGYDADLADLPLNGPRPAVSVHLAPDWRRISLESTGTGATTSSELTVPPGVVLDLGATAKAFAADRCAQAVTGALNCGAVVSLGGDVATAGPAPEGFWRVRVQDGPDQPGATVTLPAGGGLATSSTLRRRWTRGDHVLHHIIDPRTGRPALPLWRTVSAAARDCVTANTATTAALVRGAEAPAYLTGTGLPARLVAADGGVHTFNRWPARTPLTVGAAA